MKRLIFTAAFCLLVTEGGYASSCGIGAALTKFNRITQPTIEQFDVPLEIIMDQSNLRKPFYSCDDDDDLIPGIAFMKKYMNVLLDMGRTENDPGVVAMRKTLASMQRVYDNIQARN